MKTELEVGGRTKLFSEDVAYFEADVNYTIIHFYEGRDKIVATTIGHIHDRMGQHSCFIRPNRAFLINLEFINSYQLGELLLHNNMKVQISRRRRNDLTSVVENYLSNK
jgi:DNA-binding LytR/AlgR family response regulator